MDDVFRTTQHAADPLHLTDVERMHVPVIELPDSIAAHEMFPITVKVGQVPHAMDPEHYIRFVDLYADQTLLSRVTFVPAVLKPKTTFFLEMAEPTLLRAVAFCNLHGFWASEKPIKVE